VCGCDRRWLIPPICSWGFTFAMGIFQAWLDFDHEQYVYVFFHPGMTVLSLIMALLFLGAFFIQDDKDFNELFKQAQRVKLQDAAKFEEPVKQERVEVEMGYVASFRQKTEEAQKEWKRRSMEHWYIGCALTLAIPPITIAVAYQVEDGLDPFLSKPGPTWCKWAYRICIIVVVAASTPIWILLTKSLEYMHCLIGSVEKEIKEEKWEVALRKLRLARAIISKNFELDSITSVSVMWLELGVLVPMLLYLLGFLVLVFNDIIDPHQINVGSREFIWAVLLFGALLAILCIYMIGKVSKQFDGLEGLAWEFFHRDIELADPTKTTPQDTKLLCNLHWHQKFIDFLANNQSGIYLFKRRIDRDFLDKAWQFLIAYIPILYGACKAFIHTKDVNKFIHAFTNSTVGA